MIIAPITTAATSHSVRVTRDKRRVMLGVLLPSGVWRQGGAAAPP